MKIKRNFVCSECHNTFPKWYGLCPSCKMAGTIEEQEVSPASIHSKPNKFETWSGQKSQVVALSEVSTSNVFRYSSGISELDRALGGGLVTASVVILGGDPGIGKSTLLLQVVDHLEKNDVGCLYVTAEESPEQIANRAERLGLDPSKINIYAENKLEDIIDELLKRKPKFVVIDSIQTIYTDTLTSAPGTISQVKDCSAFITRIAKKNGITVFLVGQVTKDGSLAGPKVFEHIVDTSLFFEGDSQSVFRIIRATKNRFGAVNEIGAFEMTAEGLISVDNPSAMFLSEGKSASPGSCVFIMQEGQRPMLIELQALVDDSNFGNPRRSVVGVDYNRLSMVLAVLHKHGGLSCGDQDVYLNAVGGVKATETASDLPICMAIISSIRGVSIPNSVACFGEVGLTGEIRPVLKADDRIKEAVNMGYEKIIMPKRNLPKKSLKGIVCVGVENMSELIAVFKEL